MADYKERKERMRKKRTNKAEYNKFPSPNNVQHLKSDQKLRTPEDEICQKLSSNWDRYDELPENDDNCAITDFKTLLNAPISNGGHFVFKLEKNWAIESSKYSKLFSLNIKQLGKAIDCIPFNQYIDVDDKYFTKDQLTEIHNTAERAKIDYLQKVEMIDSVARDMQKCNIKSDDIKIESVTVPEALMISEEHNTTQTNDVEEELDFLLSLKEPIKSDPITMTQPSRSYSEEVKAQTADKNAKSIDLEKWLDSVLDD
ncbi:uncharacterized protein LOC107264189 [Cephus cinctus]|uniref:Uncharacterized protein LOC107264189 n=1 Tax=Cephus cinctus TaxID=211228 RepID=A0AAJ7RA35_CEPCN|nr:uncharacterized protein LOC107264189 [Cephus cinctus]